MYLWLDDVRDPKDSEIQKRFGAIGNEQWVKTPQETIELLKTGNVKSISFDHDLGLPEPEDGYQVAKWIEEQAFLKQIPKLIWRVHSTNPNGAKYIKAAMKNADRFWAELLI
jgi:hypothetical protein